MFDSDVRNRDIRTTSFDKTVRLHKNSPNLIAGFCVWKTMNTGNAPRFCNTMPRRMMVGTASRHGRILKMSCNGIASRRHMTRQHGHPMICLSCLGVALEVSKTYGGLCKISKAADTYRKKLRDTLPENRQECAPRSPDQRPPLTELSY